MKEVLKKIRYFGLVSVLICAVLLAGCGAKEEPLPEKEEPGQQTVTEETQKPEQPQEEEKQPEELVDRYRSQLQFYRQALEPLLGLPVKEMLLYSFHLEKTVEVSL